MVWKKDFIKNNEVVIEKTGRFGVGVLAAFLLGNEFELYTRYHKDQKGFKCHASLSSRQVELLKCECKIGTYIKIDLNDDINAEINKVIKLNKNGTIKQSVSNSLDWFNWYLMSSPKLDYEFENDDLKLIFSHSKQNISSKPEHPNNGWYSFETEDFKAIHWTINNNYYSYKSQKNSGELYCNGFKISRGYDFSDCNYPYNAPKVSVFDGNARMPLSLNRDYLLNDKLPFEKRLATEIFNKIIDVLLKVEFEKRGSYWIPRPIYLELKKSIDLSEYIIIKGNSYTLKLPFIFRNLDVNVLYSIWLKNISANNTLLSPDSFYQPYIKNSDPNYFYKDLLELSSYKKYLIRRWFMLGVTNTDELHIKISHQNNYILNDKVLYMFEKNRLTKSFKESHKHQLFNDQWSIVTHKRSKNNNNNSKILTQNLASKYYYFISENYIKRDDIPEKSWGLFEEIWIKRFKSNSFLIPIDKDSR